MYRCRCPKDVIALAQKKVNVRRLSVIQSLHDQMIALVVLLVLRFVLMAVSQSIVKKVEE